MPFTIEDFEREFFKEHSTKMTAEEGREILQSLPAKERLEVLKSLFLLDRADFLQSLPVGTRLAGLSVEQIQQYLDGLTAARKSALCRSKKGK